MTARDRDAVLHITQRSRTSPRGALDLLEALEGLRRISSTRALRADFSRVRYFRRDDSRWAPWTAIDGNDKKAARIAALSRVADTLAAALPADPPPFRPEMEQAAQEFLKNRG